MRIAWVSDHLVYLPSIGLIGLAAAGLGALYDKTGPQTRSRLRVAGWLGLGAMIITSRVYADVYSDLETMCRYTVEANPDAWLAHQLLSFTAHAKGEDVTWRSRRRRTLFVCGPTCWKRKTVSAWRSKQKGVSRRRPSIFRKRSASRHTPCNAFSLAKCLLEAGRYDPSLQLYQQLLQDYPQEPVLPLQRGYVPFWNWAAQTKRSAQYQQALAIDPGLDSVRGNLQAGAKDTRR